ncbi:MAG: PDZ domain-containing protein [Proteobacteria bacterium]|nr:PDZ domain-containing protein [Pseudomonadota bacterium]
MFCRRILLGSLFIGLGVLFSGQGSGQKKESVFGEAPSCSDVIQIFSWSRKNHGLTEPSLRDPGFAKKVAALFAEKADPHYILFLETEVNQLSQKVSKRWNSFVQKNECGVFTSWFDETLAMAKKRLDSRNALKPKSASTPAPVKYHSFAATPQELAQRQKAFLESVPYEAKEILFPDDLDSKTILVKALLGALDPYSTYFSESEFSDFYEELSGKSAGVGITVEKSFKGLQITEVTAKSPAFLAGIKSGDQIVEVDGKSLSELSFKQAAQLLKGEDETELELTLENQNGRSVKTLKRTTQVFEDKKVATLQVKKEHDKQIALISVPSFYGRGGLGSENENERSSAEDLRNQIETLQEKGNLNALILDLRGNPGGYLEEAITMAGFFLGPKAVVGIKDREELRTLKADWTEKPIYTGSLIVWVDEETASAGEVLAAALKDHQRAILVGSPTTFGKGSVQKLIRLNDPFLNLKLEKNTGVIKLTTSAFFSPLGHSPVNGGVKTHIALTEKSPQSVAHEMKPQGLKTKDLEPLMDSSQLKEINDKASEIQSLVARIQNSERDEESAMVTQVFEIADQVLELKTF